MSLHLGRIGGQYRSPYTKSDRMKVRLVAAVLFLFAFAPLIVAVKLLVFG